jgi:hypothetical protein
MTVDGGQKISDDEAANYTDYNKCIRVDTSNLVLVTTIINIKVDALLQNVSIAADCLTLTNGYLMTCIYSGSSVMSPNRLSLLWTSVATVLDDIIS